MSKKQLQISVFLVVSFSFFGFFSKADHYMGAFFTYTYLGNDQFKGRLYTLTDTRGIDPIRDSVRVNWGDNENDFWKKININDPNSLLYPNTQVNIYESVHQFKKYGNYQLTFLDPFRLGDLVNMQRGQSRTTQMYTYSILPYHDEAIYCTNSSPIPTAIPNLRYRVGDDALINWGLKDPDGDSLVYELTPIRGRNGGAVSGYFIPNNASLDKQTGTLKMTNLSRGDFAFAIKVTEFRYHKKIGEHLIDFTVRVQATNDSRPTGELSVQQYDFNALPAQTSTSWMFDCTDADSVWGTVLGSMDTLDAFTMVMDTLDMGQTSFSIHLSLTQNTLSTAQGKQNLVLRGHCKRGAVLLYEDVYFFASVQNHQNWNCIVPDLFDIEDIIPDLLPFEPLSTVFYNNGFWLDVGQNTSGIVVELRDARGRLVRFFENIPTSPFKIETDNLSYGIYLLILYNPNTNQKSTHKLLKQ